MIITRISLVAFPDELCVIEKVDLRVLMQRAVRIEARMEKGVKIEDEYRRYQTYCDRLEYYGVHLACQGEAPVLDLGPEYPELLLTAEERDPEKAREAKLFSNFCPADQVQSRIERFEALMRDLGLSDQTAVQNKIEFYRTATSNGMHVIEIQEMISDQTSSDVTDPGALAAYDSLKVRDDIVQLTDENAYKGLRSQFVETIRNLRQGISASVNFSDLGHHVITEILHEFVYGDKRPMMIPVIYADGSEAPPFPINILRSRSGRELERMAKEPVVSVGMMSQRHEEMDPKISFYWFRNQEISTGKRSAEIDLLAYTQTKKRLVQMRQEGIYRIAFYQTGFQPAVVGFYRALAEEIRERGNRGPLIEVTPMYYLVDRYKPGKVWV